MRCRIIQGLLIKRNEGFTLLEVMIALVILAVGLLGLAALQLVAVKSNAFSSEMTYATMLAQQHAEVLKSLPYTDANLTPGTHTAVGSSKGVQYSVTWNVTDNVPATDMKSVNVTVLWLSLRQGAAGQGQTPQQQTVTASLQTIIRNQS